jgi:hypothetical protein
MQDDRRSFFEQIHHAPLFTTAALAEQWASIARRREPWRSMPLDDLLGELRAVISVMLRAVPVRDDRIPRRLELCGRIHGSFRRRQGIGVAAVTDESIMLLEALQDILQRHGASAGIVEAVIAHLGRDLHLVRRAMSAGYLDGPSCPRA